MLSTLTDGLELLVVALGGRAAHYRGGRTTYELELDIVFALRRAARRDGDGDSSGAATTATSTSTHSQPRRRHVDGALAAGGAR